jgi:sigma-B regulation protein RsbU (phosphoserine phosphatase)
VTSNDGTLRGVHAVTDTALAHLDVESLVAELLARVQEELRVDTATVLLLDPYGDELVATASLGLAEEVAQGVRLPVGRGFAGTVAATRSAVQLQDIGPGSVLNPILIERGIQSILGVPMIAAGELVGVLHVGSLHHRVFDSGEVNLLQVAAERMALATQTRLMALDRATTVALQRSLLPARHIELPGLQVAARYVPGARAGVGGDWYDAFALPSGHVGVAIGDVAGHGLRAAVVMGRIRSALRAYALDYDDPAEVLSRLDRKITMFEAGAMATAVYAVISPDLSRMRISLAGHPPPVLTGPEHPGRLLEIPPDLPLGVQPGSRRRVTELPFSPGAVLLLYTDGLVERRGEPLYTSLERLCQAVPAGPAEQACVRVMLTMVGSATVTDDIAVLAITRDPDVGQLSAAVPVAA